VDHFSAHDDPQVHTNPHERNETGEIFGPTTEEKSFVFDATTKVRDVALIPEATRILEKLKIDYCCGGERPLAEACEQAGVKLEVLQRKLEEAQDHSEVTIDFQKMSLTELIDHIVDKHHVFTANEMERLEGLVTKVISAHATNHPELLEVGRLLAALFDELKPHMFKEEQVLFPFVFELERAATQQLRAPIPPFGTVMNPVRMMMIEHDNAGTLLKELRRVTSNYSVPDDACMSYQALYKGIEAFEQDLHQHIHLENNLLFPKAIEIENHRLTK
jgi:regulator of cell morphogenesis and NO signaling